MAIWQYKIFMVPEEEINSYFKNDSAINQDDLNEIKWWKYHQLSINSFNLFENILPKKKSWSDEILLFGEESSNCIEILIEDDIIVEISIRFDLRTNYQDLLRSLCTFAEDNDCVFLDYKLEILYPSIHLLNEKISSYKIYNSFLDKLNNEEEDNF